MLYSDVVVIFFFFFMQYCRKKFLYISDSNHYGIAGWYAMQASQQGLLVRTFHAFYSTLTHSKYVHVFSWCVCINLQTQFNHKYKMGNPATGQKGYSLTNEAMGKRQ